MKGKLIASFLLACLPWLAMAQSNDDLYFIPKKEKKTEAKQKVEVAPKQVSVETAKNTSPGRTVVVKDAGGKTRDVDEYNRRYTSRDNTFSMKNDTLYIEEKPYSERGEWVNGFQGSQSDYEYAMRIVRFRSPRYAIPVSSPLYWDVVYSGVYPSWDWNVYDDGMYAYVFPTYTNRLWWDWRYSWGPSFSFSWGWHSPWYYSGWYSPYWYGSYWGGYWGPGWYAPYYPHYHYPHYGWASPRPPYTYNNRRAPVNHSIRNASSGRPGDTGRRVGSVYDRNGRTGGRVVSGSRDARSGVRVDGNTGRIYTRPGTSSGRGGTTTYTRPQNDRTNGAARRSSAFERTRNYNNSERSNSNSSYRRSSGSSGSSFRSSGGSSSRGSGMGGSSRGGGARRR